jgi:hypothetical protein
VVWVKNHMVTVKIKHTNKAITQIHIIPADKLFRIDLCWPELINFSPCNRHYWPAFGSFLCFQWCSCVHCHWQLLIDPGITVYLLSMVHLESCYVCGNNYVVGSCVKVVGNCVIVVNGKRCTVMLSVYIGPKLFVSSHFHCGYGMHGTCHCLC